MTDHHQVQDDGSGMIPQDFQGFTLPSRISFNARDDTNQRTAPPSVLSLEEAIGHVQLLSLSAGEGSLLFFPRKPGSEIGTNLDVGDVLFLRERTTQSEPEGIPRTAMPPQEENGVVVQIISLGTANYPHSQTKALFRLMVNVRASELLRAHNEPPETVDELLEAQFKVRASITRGEWGPPEGRVVTRNVDIFWLNPSILANHIFTQIPVARFGRDEYQAFIQQLPGATEILPQVTHSRFINEEPAEMFVSYSEISEEDKVTLGTEALSGLKQRSPNIDLGDYKEERVEFFGSGFEKINLITGMKGGGKSHIAKGIISESLRGGMSAVVFDVNNEYNGLPHSTTFLPGENLRFRLDRMRPATFLGLIDRIAPFAERTRILANAQLPRIIRGSHGTPDIAWLRGQADNIIPGQSEPARNMRASYTSSLDVIERTNLVMTRAEAEQEDAFIRESMQGRDAQPPNVFSLSAALFNVENTDRAGIIVFSIGGLLQNVQYTVIDMILDALKDICARQTLAVRNGARTVPNYPTVYFEEAHMYMEPRVIDELLPLIRHYGMNVFFITNTPVALPESVFRLIDNLIMTRLLNKRDIDQVKNCGLTDSDTIEGFAHDLKERHALILSGIDGATRNFPLVFRVRDFGLPPSGETRSMWHALAAHMQTRQ